jgi:L-2-hydroxyglutarate oxidase
MNYDYIIVGGGIVGLSVAWSILERDPGLRIAVIEKENDWACHQTGRNSGVIHSGIYYKPGSLKARLCSQGNQRLLRFCEKHGVRHDVCGKVIVATTPEQLPLLGKLHQRGMENGLEVERLSPDGVHALEPHVKCVAGLRVPSTGIVSYAEVCHKLVGLIRDSGGDLIVGSRVVGLRNGNSEIAVETDSDTYHARWLVNCGGLHSDRIARFAGCRPAARIVPFRGEYYELKPARRNLVRSLIYPVPDSRFWVFISPA